MPDAGLAWCIRCAMTRASEFVYILGCYINVLLLLLLHPASGALDLSTKFMILPKSVKFYRSENKHKEKKLKKKKSKKATR